MGLVLVTFSDDYFNLVLADSDAHQSPPVITDMLGRRVDAHITQTAQGWQIDMTGQAAGAYMLQLDTPSGMVAQRLVVQ